MNPTPRATLLASAVALFAASAEAQSLFRRPINAAPPPSPGQPQPGAPPSPPAGPAAQNPPPAEPPGAEGASGTAQPIAPTPMVAGPMLDQVSLIAVIPPKPKTYQKHDRIEIIVNETSAQKAEQSLETKKKYDLKAELSQFPSLRRLIQDATIGEGIGTNTPKATFSGTDNYKGDGTAERKDRFTARISALVIDVKPNGMLVVEAREVQQFDDDTKTLVVAGMCDPKSITAQGTVQSSQIANLVIKVEHSGDVRDGAKKGWIPQLLDTIFGV